MAGANHENYSVNFYQKSFTRSRKTILGVEIAKYDN